LKLAHPLIQDCIENTSRFQFGNPAIAVITGYVVTVTESILTVYIKPEVKMNVRMYGLSNDQKVTHYCICY